MQKADFQETEAEETISAGKEKWNTCIKALLPDRIRFIAWGSVNCLFLGSIYYSIHQKDSAWYITSSVLAIFALLLWTHTQSMLEFRIPVYVRHLICLLLPYSLLLADLLNSQWKNKAYFLSQVFVYFTLGTIFLSLDVLLRDSGFNKGTFRKILVAFWGAVCSLLLVLFLLLSINTLLGNTSLDYDAVIAICQTDIAEAAGYFTRLNHRYLLLALFFITVLGLLALNLLPVRFPCRCGKREVQCRLAGVLFAALFLAAAEIGLHEKLYFSNIFKLMASPVSYFQENRRFQELRGNYEAFVREKFKGEPKNPLASGIFVIIIGESLNRHYMSVYGYQTDTTPFQRKLSEDRNVTLFQRPYSAYAQTIRCIAYMLTDQNQYDNRDKTLQNSISLFDIARYNGFTTRWFSAQGTALLLDSPTAVLAESAEYSFSLPAVRGKIGHKATDMDLLEFLPRQLNDKEFIVIQLMGSHYPYGHVYPAGFMAESPLSDYEKSVCYNDMVLKKLFEYFRGKNASAILYLSDHSEDVANDRGHDPRIEVFTQAMTEIPFWLYLSPEYSIAHPSAGKQLERAEWRVFTADLLFDLMIHLMNLKSTFTDQSKNILADEYFLNENNARTLGGKVKLNIPPAPGAE